MNRKLKWMLLALFSLAGWTLLAPSLPAQTTNVTATVTDPNGIPYANATVNIVLQPPGVSSPQLAGQLISGRNTSTLSDSGVLNVTLPDNAIVTPANTQWQFTICSTGVQPPLGFGNQCFNVTLTITGAIQSITTQLNAAAPALTRVINTPPSGGFTASLIPSVTNTFDIGTTTLRWRNGFFQGNMTIVGSTIHSGNILPAVTNTTDIGVTGTRFRNGFFAGTFEATGNALFGGTVTATGDILPANDNQIGLGTAAIRLRRAFFSETVAVGTRTFAQLPAAPADGTLTFCSDCTKATPCAGAGPGALAKRISGAWDCN